MFPQFEILQQYVSRECIELKNRNKFPLLVLDDAFFPLFMDWALESGFSDCLLFLFENDAFRFQTQLSGQTQTLRVQTVVEQLDRVYGQQEYAGHMRVIRELTSCGICMPAAFASLCSFVWKDFLVKGQRIHKSGVWPSFRNKIVENICIDSSTVIGDDHHHIYFQQFLTYTKGDTACLACWRDVRHVTAALEHLKKRDRDKRDFSSAALLPKASPPTTAGSSPRPIISKSNSTSSDDTRMDPYESLDILLECMRKLHGMIIRGKCSGPSPNTKIVLAESFQKTASIRHVQSVDKDFARECCDMLESLLCSIQKECHVHLLLRYESFRDSKEFHALMASVRLSASEAVQQYLRNSSFLQDVRDGKLMPWRLTSETLFTSYLKGLQKLRQFVNVPTDCPTLLAASPAASSNGPWTPQAENKHTHDLIKDIALGCTEGAIDKRRGAIETSPRGEANDTCGYESSYSSDCDVFGFIAVRVELENRMERQFAPPPATRTCFWVGISDPGICRRDHTCTLAHHETEVNGDEDNSCGGSVLVKLAGVCTNASKKSHSTEDSTETDPSITAERSPADAHICLEEMGGRIMKACGQITGVSELEVGQLSDSSDRSVEPTASAASGDDTSADPQAVTSASTVTTDKDLVDMFHTLLASLRDGDGAGESEDVDPFQRDESERVLYLSFARRRIASDQSGNRRGGVEHVVVLSIFPLLNTLSSIASKLIGHCSGTDSPINRLCSECGLRLGDLVVPLPVLQFESCDTNVRSYRVTRSRMANLRQEKVTEFFVNPPVGSASRVSKWSCDVALLPLVRRVSPLMTLLMMVRVMGNRSLVLHSTSSEMVAHTITTLLCLIQPLQPVGFDVAHHCGDIDSYRYWKGNPLLVSAEYRLPFVLGLSSDVASAIIQKHSDYEFFPRLSAELSDSMDVSFGNMSARRNTVVEFGCYDMTDVTFFDIDTEKVWSTWSRSFSSACDGDLHVLPSHVVERLCTRINAISGSYCSFLRQQDWKKTLLHESVPMVSGRRVGVLTRYNRLVEEAFGRVQMDVFLGCLPSALSHYPDSHVVSCDIKTLFMESVCVAGRSANDSHFCGKDRYEVSRLYRDRIEFLEALVDSPAFVHLLQRLGLALDCTI